MRCWVKIQMQYTKSAAKKTNFNLLYSWFPQRLAQKPSKSEENLDTFFKNARNFDFQNKIFLLVSSDYKPGKTEI